MFEIGSSLRDARLRQGLDMADLEARTKVRAKYLHALEDERFDQLPAATYVKGFLRAYADALGLDGRLYVEEYSSRYVAGDEETPLRARRVPPGARGPRGRRESHLVALALAAIAVVTALVIAAWKFGGADDPTVRGLGSVDAAPPATATVRPAIVLRAVGGDSFVEVRSGGRGGKPLFSGTLERGQSKLFSQSRLWMTVASPDNVRLTVSGRSARVPTGGELVIAGGKVRAAGAA